ncbi:sulfur carrier protein ThiS adenylyltransferase [Clostridium sp. USBA 49]|uniref:sulfur carrier protein ThiS adenylyltransferase ThiF n=1 Tax=Clostridium sp. USBA 49 TaxID=1881060 RepID=UPI00099B1521|nr:sulfur carrier protein ThiS adenylyltransferase ThiF [Clostridium sp. USBA 49]SKA73998.1 sulfur carrier protein ThiS adenylyltransferase [Clostridium sp. USBA 49]
MQIYINEKILEVENYSTIFQIKEKYKKDADIIIYNGFPVNKDIHLKPFDKVALIKKGEIPKKEELETLMVSRHTPYIHEKLKKAKVGIAGLGGLGSNVAVSLTRMGVGKLVIVDFDVVEASNLNRQYYFVKHIGMKKTEAMKEILKDCNPFVDVESFDTYLDENSVQKIFKNVDIIIEAFDDPICKSMIVNTVITKMKDKKIIAASGVAGHYTANTIVTRRVKENFYIVGDMKSEAKEGLGLMAPRVAVAANHQANIAVRLIIGEEN